MFLLHRADLFSFKKLTLINQDQRLDDFQSPPRPKYKMSKLNNDQTIVEHFFKFLKAAEGSIFWSYFNEKSVYYLLFIIFQLDSPVGGCNCSVPRRSDGCDNDGMFAITEHVGVEASTRQIGVTLAHCQTARWIAERSRVNCSGTGYTHRTPRYLLKQPSELKPVQKDTIRMRSRRWSGSAVSAGLDQAVSSLGSGVHWYLKFVV